MGGRFDGDEVSADAPQHVAETPEERARAEVDGFVAEMELQRRVAESGSLNLFHATPDDELTEYLVRRVGTGAMLAVQVKCLGGVAPGEGVHPVRLDRLALAAAPRGVLVVFGRQLDGTPVDSCLVAPFEGVTGMTQPAGEREVRVELSLAADWAPGAGWRVPLSALANRLELIARAQGG